MATLGPPSDPSVLCCKLDYTAEQLKVLNTNALDLEFYHSRWPLNLPVINYLLFPSRKTNSVMGKFTFSM